MPELPEVETLCRQLDGIVKGEKILRSEVLDSLLGEIPQLAGHEFLGVARRGKFIDITLADGLTVILHLRMTGRLFYQPGQAAPPFTNIERPLPAYSRLIIHFTGGTLFLIDPRRFATVAVKPSSGAPAPVPDPLKGIAARVFLEMARTRTIPVKSFLMDQRAIAGIGNIYASEILFSSGIDPRRTAKSLTLGEWGKVKKAAGEILRRAVACRGTTVSDWRDLFGEMGKNQDNLNVYSRHGEACRRCGGTIERIKQGGRGTWFCPACQK
jgi:formamidopyrimidine-DNA glycosylase